MCRCPIGPASDCSSSTTCEQACPMAPQMCRTAFVWPLESVCLCPAYITRGDRMAPVPAFVPTATHACLARSRQPHVAILALRRARSEVQPSLTEQPSSFHFSRQTTIIYPAPSAQNVRTGDGGRGEFLPWAQLRQVSNATRC